MQKEEIKIWWEGPFSIDDIISGKIDNFKGDVKSDSKGLYQIYGSHPLYGDGVLVYIGRTQNKDGFKSRLNGRWVIENGNDPKNVKIYLGTIFSDSIDITNNENIMIEKAEVLLINAMKPAFNSSNIQSVKSDLQQEEYIVYNNGSYRNLYPILDSSYFWKEFKNYTLVNELSEKLGISTQDKENEFYGFELNESELYIIPDDYKIWFGVDYEIWNKKGTPLTIQIYSSNDNLMNKIINLNISNYFEYIDNEKTTYISIDANNTIEKINKKIESIIKQLHQEL